MEEKRIWVVLYTIEDSGMPRHSVVHYELKDACSELKALFNEQLERIKTLRYRIVDYTNELNNTSYAYINYRDKYDDLKSLVFRVVNLDVKFGDSKKATTEETEDDKKWYYGKKMWRFMAPSRKDLVPFVLALCDHTSVREYKIVSNSLIYVVFDDSVSFDNGDDIYDFIGKIAELNNYNKPEFIGYELSWKKYGKNGDKQYDKDYLIAACSGEWISGKKD